MYRRGPRAERPDTLGGNWFAAGQNGPQPEPSEQSQIRGESGKPTPSGCPLPVAHTVVSYYDHTVLDSFRDRMLAAKETET